MWKVLMSMFVCVCLWPIKLKTQNAEVGIGKLKTEGEKVRRSEGEWAKGKS
jgi:hypothetical protein